MPSISYPIAITTNPCKGKKHCQMNCMYLLKAKNISFCLKYKEVISKCPLLCPFFVEGKPGHYQDAIEKQFDIDCLYCTRKKVPQQKHNNEPTFYCSLYENSRPFCGRCLLVLYPNDPIQIDERNSPKEQNRR